MKRMYIATVIVFAMTLACYAPPVDVDTGKAHAGADGRNTIEVREKFIRDFEAREARERAAAEKAAAEKAAAEKAAAEKAAAEKAAAEKAAAEKAAAEKAAAEKAAAEKAAAEKAAAEKAAAEKAAAEKAAAEKSITDSSPLRSIKEPLPPNQLAARDHLIEVSTQAVAESRGVDKNEVDVTSLFRTDSAAHVRGAVDVGVKDSNNPYRDALRASAAVGKDHLVILEEPGTPKLGKQMNTYFQNGKQIDQRVGNIGKGEFHATGPHIHIQPNRPAPTDP